MPPFCPLGIGKRDRRDEWASCLELGHDHISIDAQPEAASHALPRGLEGLLGCGVFNRRCR
jgi:hypothetical protein